jgi:hypothetical protein
VHHEEEEEEENAYEYEPGENRDMDPQTRAELDELTAELRKGRLGGGFPAEPVRRKKKKHPPPPPAP